MRRRSIIAGFTGVTAALSARRVTAAQPVRIGQLGGVDAELVTALTALGLVQGRDFTSQTYVGAQDAQARREGIRTLLPNSDLLVVWGTLGGMAAKTEAVAIPVVFLSVGAPVEIGLVASLARPGGNMTGITFEAGSTTYAKRLQFLKEIMPSLSRVGVLGARGDANVPFALTSLNEQAPLMGMRVFAAEFGSAAELKAAFDELRRQDVEALVAVASLLTFGTRQPIADLALAHRLPSCHGFRESVEAGGLISLGPNRLATLRQGARLVAKIIAGAKPADIPVEQPAEYTLALNLSTARRLGINLPPTLVARADTLVD